ncbi:hypothetical protein, partial [Staphylococcus epidermidis]|uniref:hypothetical protein n=1 Tax=Staphylococcus epidermidis TaxID=1282 RepID=UPI001C9318B6
LLSFDFTTRGQVNDVSFFSFVLTLLSVFLLPIFSTLQHPSFTLLSLSSIHSHSLRSLPFQDHS